jgi:hypothetical protein
MAGTFPLTSNGTANWSSGNVLVCGGKTLTITVRCGFGQVGCNDLVLDMVCQNTIASGQHPDAGCSCNPLSLTYSNLTVTGGCCTGTVSVTVTL